MVKPDPELEELQKLYEQAQQEHNDMLRQIENATEEAKTDLREQLGRVDARREGFRSEIESRGGSVAPQTPPSPQPEPPAQPSPPPQPQLHAPPTSIDEQWNKLVKNYEDALQEAVDHATMKQDDWGCGDLCEGANHNGCAIWWRGQMDVVLFNLRDAAHKLLEDLAGPSTEDEIAAGNVVPRIRKEVEEVEAEIERAEVNLQKLIDQFHRDEETYKALREAGGDVGPGTGAVSAGRARLLFDIYKARQLVNKLHADKHKILGRLNAAGGQALQLRRQRGLERTKGRYGWDGVDLNLDGLSDEQLLQGLIGPEQYELMQEERDKQGTQMRIGAGGRKVGMRDFTPGVFFAAMPPLLRLGALAVLLLLFLGAMLFLLTGSDDSGLDDSTAQSGAVNAGAAGAVGPDTTATAAAEQTSTASQAATSTAAASAAATATQQAAAAATTAAAEEQTAIAANAAAEITPELAVTPAPASELPPGDVYELKTGWTLILQLPQEVHAGQPFTFTYYVYDPDGNPASGTAEASAGLNGDFTAPGASHGTVVLENGCAMFTLNPTASAGETVTLAIYFPQAAPVSLTVAEITVLP